MITNIDGTTEYEVSLNDSYIKIGGETEKFVPNLNFNKWGDEAWLNINHADTIVAAQKEILVNGVLHLVINGIEHKYYVDPDNNMEYEIVIKSRPALNYIEFDIDFSPNVEFYYQDTLENEWAASPGLQKMHSTLEDFLIHADRADNVIHSYAVYINKKNDGYKTGKLCHIYRPKIIDNNNDEVWGTLEIDSITKKMRVHIDSGWLDKAVYPITIDPTIGYSTAGSANYGSNTTKVGTLFTSPASAGNTTFYHIAINAVGVSTGLKQSIYDTSGGSVANQALLEQITTVASVTDDLQTAGGGAAIVASTLYWLGFIPEDAATKIKYDTAVPTDTEYQTGATYGTEFADPFGAVTATIGWIVSMWVDYTSAGVNYSGPIYHHFSTMRQ